MKKVSRTLPVLALLGMLFIPAHADNMKGMAGMETDMHTAMSSHKGQGSVNSVDAATNTVNLTHGPIKSLGWMGMTMDFKVKNKTSLDKIKVGMKVDFDVTKAPDGSFVITTITPVK